MHACQKPGSLRVLFSCNTVEFNGLRAITSRTPIFTGSDSRSLRDPFLQLRSGYLWVTDGPGAEIE